MPELGNGFDSASRKEKPLSIFSSSLKPKLEEHTKFAFSSSIYRNTEDYLRKLSANSILSAVATQSVSLTAALEFSSDLRRNQDDLIYVINILGIRQRVSADLDEATFDSDSQLALARKVLKEKPMDFWNKYGDSFISSVFYGKEVAIVIKFKKSSAEDIQKKDINLEASFANIAHLKQAVDFLKTLSKNDLKCEIFIQAKGFAPGQLPPSDPNNFSELADWLSDFEDSFKDLNPNQLATPIGYEFESYGVIFPSEASLVVAQGELKGKYMLAIQRCNQVVDFYIAYYNWLGEYNKANEFSLKKDQLASIQTTVERRSKVTDPAVIEASNMLKMIISSLNEENADGKLINKFTNAQLSHNIIDGDLSTSQKVSKPFQILDLPPGEGANFSFKINSSKPLLGTISFFYSLDKKVGYNSGSHRIASEISQDATNKADVPSTLKKDNIRKMFFAYHYDKIIRGTWNKICRNIPGCHKSDEEFSVETYLHGRKPSPILSVG